MQVVTVVLAVAASVGALAAQGGVPTRVYEGGTGRVSDLDSVVAAVATADIVFVGEQHNDVNTHRVELALLESLARRRGNIVLALEMFERDAQEALEHFLLDHTTEAEFLAESRPWPEYVRDYKPLVDLAIAKSWYVVAANVPRHIAAVVSEGGLEALAARPPSEKSLYAADVRCPSGDDYYTRFVTAMGGGHVVAGATALSPTSVERYYQAQCLKDETMAESIALVYNGSAVGGTRPLVVVVNGAFHSDFSQGTVARTKRRLADRRVVVTTIVPVDRLDRVSPDAEARRRADYLIYSQK